MVTLIVSSRNAHKLGEIRAILGPAFNCIGLGQFAGAPAIVEDAATFEGNATKKAVGLARWLRSQNNQTIPKGQNCYVLADDSGLEVDALGGAPGVHSARFAAFEGMRPTPGDPATAGGPAGGPANSSDSLNNQKLLRLLKDTPAAERTGRFRCVIALTPLSGAAVISASPVCSADEFEIQTTLFHGRCEGRISDKPSGQGGFGYDPLFVPNGYDTSFAELGEETKNSISHRSQALAALRKWFDASR